MKEHREDWRGDPRSRSVVTFVVIVLVATLFLRLLGAPPLLVLEVFGLALILGVAAVLVVLIYGDRLHLRKGL